jgi:hypothetical protein
MCVLSLYARHSIRTIFITSPLCLSVSLPVYYPHPAPLTPTYPGPWPGPCQCVPFFCLYHLRVTGLYRKGGIQNWDRLLHFRFIGTNSIISHTHSRSLKPICITTAATSSGSTQFILVLHRTPTHQAAQRAGDFRPLRRQMMIKLDCSEIYRCAP